VRPRKGEGPAAYLADEPPGDDLLGRLIASSPTPKEKTVQVIRAELTGNACSAGRLTASGHAPVLSLARKLIAIGQDASASLEVWRGGVLALRVRSIGEAAGLTVEDDRHGRPRLRHWRDRIQGCGAGPSARQKRGDATTAPSNAADAESGR
jgi:hypothetical protein